MSHLLLAPTPPPPMMSRLLLMAGQLPLLVCRVSPMLCWQSQQRGLPPAVGRWRQVPIRPPTSIIPIPITTTTIRWRVHQEGPSSSRQQRSRGRRWQPPLSASVGELLAEEAERQQLRSFQQLLVECLPERAVYSQRCWQQDQKDLADDELMIGLMLPK